MIFYIHGYGGYSGRMAYFFKHLALTGNYECFALDQRGFGKSEGERGWIESEEVMYADLMAFVFGVVNKYKVNLQTTPLFLFGKSYGGLMCFNIASKL